MDTTLRAFPLPYVAYRLTGDDISLATDVVAKLQEDGLPEYRVRGAEDTVQAEIAFSMVYGLVSHMRGRTPKHYRWDPWYNFIVGKEMIKLATCQHIDRFGNTGPGMKFRVYKNTMKKSQATVVVLAAITIPYVQFLGWMKKEELSTYLTRFAAEPSPGCEALKPMMDLKALEKRRVRGFYV